MSLISLLLIFVVVGLVVWLINTYIPMAPAVKTTMNVVVVIVLILFVLQILGVGDIQVGRIR